jgi:xanthine dehydrogenase accessory factor
MNVGNAGSIEYSLGPTAVTNALVRGANDLASAVALELAASGFRVLMLEAAAPSVTRRGQAFADAAFDGRATLAGVEALRVDDLRAWTAQAAAGVIALATRALDEALDALRPEIMVDARMRKRSVPEDQRGLAPLVIGLGPGFHAGRNVDLAIETAWGEDLGRPIYDGPTRDLAGEPMPVGGYARERYVYAPAAGVFHTQLAIGAAVRQGEIVANIGGTPIAAPISGILRGLIHEGVEIAERTKCLEVVPAGAQVFGVSERPARVAAGVIAALAKLGALFERPPRAFSVSVD